MTNLHKGHVSTEINQQIATIIFGHPASNSFPSFLLEKLTHQLTSVSTNDAVSVVVLKSEGNRTFCAGASFDELMAIENLEAGIQFFLGFANVINAMRKCSKLIIGQVQGKIVGGGVGLAAACDYVIASNKASIKLSEFTIGIGPFVIAPAVARKIGISGLSELSLDASNWKTAQWAKEKGLFSTVVESESALVSEVKNLAKKLASYNPKALIEMKKIMWENTENWDELLIERAKISGKLVLSDFTKNALKKFKNN